jgi:hypothetical protein
VFLSTQLALGIIKEAARALAATPLLIAFPIVQATGVIVFLIPWTFYMAYLASAGELIVVPGSQQRVFNYTKNSKIAMWCVRVRAASTLSVLFCSNLEFLMSLTPVCIH